MSEVAVKAEISEEAVIARWRLLLEKADLETTSGLATGDCLGRACCWEDPCADVPLFRNAEKQLRSLLVSEFPGLDVDSKTDEAKAWKAKLRAEVCGGFGHLKTASIARSQTGYDSWQTEAYLARNQAPAEDEAVEEAEEQEK